MKNICTFCIFILRARDPQDISLITKYNIKILSNQNTYQNTYVPEQTIIQVNYSYFKITNYQI